MKNYSSITKTKKSKILYIQNNEMDMQDGNGNYPLLRMIGQYSDNTYNLYVALGIKEIPNDLSYHEMMTRLFHYENSRIRRTFSYD